jgi:hypothetical protein
VQQSRRAEHEELTALTGALLRKPGLLAFARRRAAGELLGRALAKARAEGKAPPAVPAKRPPSPMPPFARWWSRLRAVGLGYIQHYFDPRGNVASSQYWLSKLNP